MRRHARVGPASQRAPAGRRVRPASALGRDHAADGGPYEERGLRGGPRRGRSRPGARLGPWHLPERDPSVRPERRTPSGQRQLFRRGGRTAPVLARGTAGVTGSRPCRGAAEPGTGPLHARDAGRPALGRFGDGSFTGYQEGPDKRTGSVEVAGPLSYAGGDGMGRARGERAGGECRRPAVERSLVPRECPGASHRTRCHGPCLAAPDRRPRMAPGPRRRGGGQDTDS